MRSYESDRAAQFLIRGQIKVYRGITYLAEEKVTVRVEQTIGELELVRGLLRRWQLAAISIAVTGQQIWFNAKLTAGSDA